MPDAGRVSSPPYLPPTKEQADRDRACLTHLLDSVPDNVHHADAIWGACEVLRFLRTLEATPCPLRGGCLHRARTRSVDP